GLLAQYPERAFEAVIGAVYLHGLAGNIACYGQNSQPGVGEQCLVATDLIRAIPEAYRQTWGNAGEKSVILGGPRIE
ncbi:MAG TPA: hypothetical protein VF447_04205, partial [Terriglobales bacterium]